MPKANPTELDRFREDHDTLIRLESKVDSLILDVKDMKDGTGVHLIDHDNRLKTLEKDVDRAVTTYKVLRWVVGVLVAIVAFIIANLTGLFHLFRP